MTNFYNRYYHYYNPYFSKKPFSSDMQNDKSVSDTINKTISCDNSTNNPCDNGTNENCAKKENSSRYYSFGPLHFKNPFFNDIEEPVFEVFGIQLYLDDIIILGLLFFLYQEGVQDELLFISLILLLLS